MEMKIIAIVELQDDASKRKLLKAVVGVAGVNSVSIDTEKKTLTVSGDQLDLVKLMLKIQKWRAQIIHVGPFDKKKKKNNKKDQIKNEPVNQEEYPIVMPETYRPYPPMQESQETYYPYQPMPGTTYYPYPPPTYPQPAYMVPQDVPGYCTIS